MKVWVSLAGVVLAAASPLAAASVHDHIFGNHFDTIADLPANANEAARFLTQATFGPVTADVNRLMQIGYSEWIDEQEGLPATHSFAIVNQIINNRSAAKPTPLNSSQTERINRWWWQATYAPDQLRQRMAFALSQIFVLSDQNSAISGDIAPMASFQDLLADDSFEIYANLLSDVTWSPSMGKYLNTFRNIKPKINNVNGTLVQITSPDENYAREVMQLFSVGLVQLDSSGNVVLTGGVPTPTYDQSVITSTAKIFTGFTYADATTGSSPNFYSGGSSTITASEPMACWGTELFTYDNPNMLHDITGDDDQPGTAKHVLGGATISGINTCASDVSQELSIIAAHPNVAPFISRQLIQRFVTSNPSATYVGHVVTAFKSSGGDLGDTLKVVLTDPEARTVTSLGTTPESDTFGKLREPVLRITALWRAFNAVAPAADIYGEVAMTGGGIGLGNLSQSPLESPTVFNFYTPDYAQPGVFVSDGKVSPEFQITNESIIYLTINTFYNLTHGAYVGMSGAPTDRPLINLNPLIFANGSSGAAPTEAAMIQYVNNAMMYGAMSSNMRTALTNMLHSGMNGASAQERAWSLVYVTMLSPEFATQR